MNLLITGGAGFIGSHVIREFVLKYPRYNIFNLDSLTYAGNLENLKDIENNKNYNFIKGDISDKNLIFDIFSKHKFDSVIHLAAESHVDRSITNPDIFIQTNVFGTVNLLNACIATWKVKTKNNLFYHVSTDEVYGSLGETGLFTEKTPYDPRSPYSASKASSDFFVKAYGETYNLPYVISNCSNNYGENHFPEKFIPLLINNIINEKPLPIYGDGKYVRDWLYVKDHAEAISLIFHNGKKGETFNIGGFNEWENIEVVKLLCNILDKKLDRSEGSSQKLIEFIDDRPGHDRRYAIDSSKIRNELGWKPKFSFEKGLEKTVNWYLNNQDWLNKVTSGEYTNYYKQKYK